MSRIGDVIIRGVTCVTVNFWKRKVFAHKTRYFRNSFGWVKNKWGK